MKRTAKVVHASLTRMVAVLLLSTVLAMAHSTVDLKVAHRTEPLGVDDSKPRLSWRIEGETPGLAQSACQILVATAPELLEPGKADLWESGRLDSPLSHANYAGKHLPSSSWIHWTVRTWSGNTASDWAAPQKFLTGLIGSQPKQSYISFRDTSPFHKERNKLHLPPARYYRGSLAPQKKIVRAIAHASALGIHELHVNGKRVGDAWFAPGWTNYRKRAYYNTFDLTPYLTNGKNAIGAIHPESQTAYVLALDCGLLPSPAERKRTGDHLAELIRSKAGASNTGMTTGFLGTKPLLPMLTFTGHHDLAVTLMQSRHYPSWGYEVENGATTIWERWNSYTREHGFGGPNGRMNAAMNSFSHYAFGAVTEWMMKDLAGIAPAEPGYAKIRLHPHFPPISPDAETRPISWVKAHHDSPHGRISIHWKRQDDGSLLYEATIPPNTSAELTLPKTSPWGNGDTSPAIRVLAPGSHRFVIP